MTNVKSTKKALIASILSLCMCFSMLLGTTFAWFTDSVTSNNNIITAGNLDVELYYQAEGQTDWTKVTKTSNIFIEDALWEPGHTEVVKLKVKNEGTLAFQYQLGVNIAGETGATNKDGDKFMLSDYIKFDVVEGEQTYNTRDEAVAAVDKTATKLNKGFSSEVTKLEAGKETVVTMVVYMPANVGNEANHNGVAPTINLGLNVLATQVTGESDSFGSDYDEDAVFGTYIELEAGADLLAAMASAEADMPLTIKLNGDVEWPTDGHHGENDITPASSIVIDGNGYTITATGSGVTPLGDTEAPMTLKNVIIVDNSVSYDEGAWELSYLEMGGKVLNCVNVDFVDPISVDSENATFVGCSFVGHYDKNSTSTTQYGVWVANGDTTFTNCTFTGTRALKICDQYAPEVGTVVVDGCTFNDISEKPGIAIDDQDTQDMKITIKNSTFINCKAGDQGLYIYETDNTIPTLENNKVLSSNTVTNGLYYDTAKKTFTVASKEGLMNLCAALLNVAPNEANIQTVDLVCDVDLKGKIWTPIEAMWVNFNGNGHTISNLTAGSDSAGRRSGFWAYAGAVTINDLTLENVTVAGSQAGTFAGSAEGAKINNCYLKGDNTVTFEAGIETWNGIGAICGVLTESNINVEIVEGTTVTLNKSGMTTATDAGCIYVDDLTGYIQKNKGKVTNNGIVKVIAITDKISNIDQVLAAGGDVVLTEDLAFSSADTTANSGYGATGVSVKGGVLDGNGNSLGINNWGTWDSAVHTTGGTIKNLTINSGMRGIFMGSATADVYIDNVVIDGTVYTFNSDGGNKDYGVYISNSTLNGWTSHSDVHKEVVYTNCNFGEGNGYAFCRPYGPTAFVGCNFAEGYKIDARGIVTFENCTIGGVALTADNLSTLVIGGIANATVK